jgi:hypothetical protein
MPMDPFTMRIAIVALLASFALPLLLVAIVLYYKHRRNRMIHETVAALAAKGLPVPPQLLDPPRRSGSASLRAGLVLVALGVAVAFFFVDHGMGWSIGLIPGLMGAALLVAWKIETRPQP